LLPAFKGIRRYRQGKSGETILSNHLRITADSSDPYFDGNFLLATDDPIAGRGEHDNMKRISNLVWKLRILKDTKGQDLIEYALMAGFVAVAAGAIMPGVAGSISTIFSKVASVMTAAAGTGS
jgi:pilus assembly protein Flp/PilA